MLSSTLGLVDHGHDHSTLVVKLRTGRWRIAPAVLLVVFTIMLAMLPSAARGQLGPNGDLPSGVAGLNQDSITGQIDMLLLRFDYPDVRYSQSNEQQDALWDDTFAHLDSYYQRQSNGKISAVTMTHPGYFDLGTPHSEITGLDDIRTKARDKAVALFDVDLEAYDVVVYAMPGGLSIPGANGGGFGSPGNIWLPQTSESGIREGMIHELGHAFSMGHSGASTSDSGDVLPSNRYESGSDPYGMMGSGQNSFKADWPLPMRHSRGWIDSDQFVDCSGNGTIRIYSSFVDRIPDGRIVGCRTIMQDPSQGDRSEDVWFSYAPSETGAAGFSDSFDIDPSFNLSGLMMHSIVNSSEPVMIDLTPGSQVSDFRLPIYVDTMDGTIRPGESVTLNDGAREVTITNLAAGGEGDDRWIDVNFDWADGGPPPTPTATPVPQGDTSIVVDGFDGLAGDALGGIGGGRGFIENWRVTRNSESASLVAGSLTYDDLVDSGQSLAITHTAEASGNSLLAERTLQQPILAGEAWLSYRLRASAVGNGHLFVSPSASGDSAIGKAWGSSFSIHNDRASTSLSPDQTYLVVARYDLDPAGPDRIDLWIDPDFSAEPSLDSAAVTKVAEVGSIDALRLNVQDHGNGRYLLDEVRLGTSWAQMVRDPANPDGIPTATPTPVPTATPTPDPTPRDVVHTVSCLAGNGRVDTTLLNHGTAQATYRIEFAGLSPRQAVVDAGDWGRLPITGRSDGTYGIRVLRGGIEISNTTVQVDCDSVSPTIDTQGVVITSACRDGLGYVVFQFLNDAPDSAGYVVAFEGVRNRSTTAAAYGQAVRAVTGRLPGTYDVTVRRAGTPVLTGQVQVDC